MRCSRAKKILELSRPGELTEREERELARHLEVCPQCRVERLQNTRFVSLVTGSRPRPVPDPADQVEVQAILETISRENTHPKRTWLMVLPRLLPVTGVLAGLFCGVLLLQTWQLTKRVSELERSQTSVVRTREGSARFSSVSKGEEQILALIEAWDLDRAGQPLERLELLRLLSLMQRLNSSELEIGRRILEEMKTELDWNQIRAEDLRYWVLRWRDADKRSQRFPHI